MVARQRTEQDLAFAGAPSAGMTASKTGRHDPWSEDATINWKPVTTWLLPGAIFTIMAQGASPANVLVISPETRRAYFPMS